MAEFGTYHRYYSRKDFVKAFKDLDDKSRMMVIEKGADDEPSRGLISITNLLPTDVIYGPNVYTDRRWSAHFKDGEISNGR